MRANFSAVLDACVLASFGLADLYLRLAETPRLYSPIWTPKILDEVFRVQTEKLEPRWDKASATRFRKALERNFPEACPHRWERFLPIATNDEGDRHVVAAALASNSELIVTFNLRHFPRAKLAPLGIKATHPEDYLKTLYAMAPAVTYSKIIAISEGYDERTEAVLKRLRKTVPGFVDHLVGELGLRI